MWYRVCHVGLANRTLISCDGVLEASCVGDGYCCRYVGVIVILVRVIAARRSLRRLFTLILVGHVQPIF